MSRELTEVVKRALRTAGFRVLRERSLPRGLDPLVDLTELAEFDPGGTAIDVGANIGDFTDALLRRGFQRVLSCEPAPESHRRLRARFSNEPRVESVQKALSAVAGQRTLDIVGPVSGLNRLGGAPSKHPGETIVEVTTLDRLVSERSVQRVAILKIDTEGHELDVLHGAEVTLSVGRIGAVLAECDFSGRGGWHRSFFELHERLNRDRFEFLGIYNVHHARRSLERCDALWVLRTAEAAR